MIISLLRICKYKLFLIIYRLSRDIIANISIVMQADGDTLKDLCAKY